MKTITSVSQDIRIGLRMIRKTPWVSAVAVLSLAMGIAANIAAFAIARTILWQRLPAAELDRLVALYNQPRRGLSFMGLSYPEYDQTMLQRPAEMLRFVLILESADKIIGVPNQACLALRVPLEPR